MVDRTYQKLPLQIEKGWIAGYVCRIQQRAQGMEKKAVWEARARETKMEKHI
jgi:hypothetical protein